MPKKINTKSNLTIPKSIPVSKSINDNDEVVKKLLELRKEFKSKISDYNFGRKQWEHEGIVKGLALAIKLLRE